MQRITKEELKKLLSNRHIDNQYKKLSQLPSPSLLIDNEKAALRVKKAIEKKERITIVGDYDVDGVISTTIMVEFFRLIDYPIEYIIPNRFKHGYGLSPTLVEELDSDLVITVDNGISAIEAANILKNRKIDLIITDHHTVGSETPYAVAVVNPKREDSLFPFSEICGAQVAWYFCAQIKITMNLSIDMSYFLDFLAIAIIADIMPMTSLNYTMVKQGLRKIVDSDKPSISLLANIISKKEIITDDIGFFIAPILNSAGRLEDASLALEFLLSKNSDEAAVLFDELQILNNRRKELQEIITKKATLEVDEDDFAVVVWGEDWHEGVIGIVASKLSNKFKRPAFVFSLKDGKAKGSARANGDVHLYELIDGAKDLLLGFGGHKNAAGLGLLEENLELFKEKINSNLRENDETLHIEDKTVGELDPYSIDLELIDIIDSYEPYGMLNLRPIFRLNNLEVLNYTLIGKEKNHLKLILNYDGVVLEAIYFNFSIDLSILSGLVNMVVSIGKNEFRGELKTQLLVKEIF